MAVWQIATGRHDGKTGSMIRTSRFTVRLRTGVFATLPQYVYKMQARTGIVGKCRINDEEGLVLF